jgi:Resolvase, N terminal domain
MIIGYCRISILGSAIRLECQRCDLAAIGADEFFCDKTRVFGKMPELERAIEFAQKGDVIAIVKPYHVARSTHGVLALIDRLGRKGVGLRILDTPIDTSTTTGRMVLGSAPLWSLGVSPVGSALRDMIFGWLYQGISRLRKAADSLPERLRRSTLPQPRRRTPEIAPTAANLESPRHPEANILAAAEGLAAATTLATTTDTAVLRAESRFPVKAGPALLETGVITAGPVVTAMEVSDAAPEDRPEVAATTPTAAAATPDAVAPVVPDGTSSPEAMYQSPDQTMGSAIVLESSDGALRPKGPKPERDSSPLDASPARSAPPGIPQGTRDLGCQNSELLAGSGVLEHPEGTVITTSSGPAAAKARGVKLGGRPQNMNNMELARKRAIEVRLARAAARLRDLTPVIEAIRGEGITSAAGIAKALNERGIPAARGGRWQAIQVQRLERSGR